MDKSELINHMCPEPKSKNFKAARDAFFQLSAFESCALLQEILEILGSSGYQVILRAYIVMQIQSRNVDLSEVFRSAAHRVSQEEPTN